MQDRIPAKGGLEDDVFSSRWRSLLCYTSKPGICKKAKKRYNKRKRKLLKPRITDLT
jgi:hypothetical protein